MKIKNVLRNIFEKRKSETNNLEVSLQNSTIPSFATYRDIYLQNIDSKEAYSVEPDAVYRMIKRPFCDVFKANINGLILSLCKTLPGPCILYTTLGDFKNDPELELSLSHRHDFIAPKDMIEVHRKGTLGGRSGIIVYTDGNSPIPFNTFSSKNDFGRDSKFYYVFEEGASNDGQIFRLTQLLYRKIGEIGKYDGEGRLPDK